MTTSSAMELSAPRFETLKPMRLAGLLERYSCQSPAGIPDQWQRFLPYLGKIPGQVGKVAYGACSNFDKEDNFDYLTGVEISGSPDLPREFSSQQIPGQKYVVFTHRGHIAGIRAVLAAIWGKWFPESGHKAVNAPMLERYGEEFDPTTGMGGFEIWIPIES